LSDVPDIFASMAMVPPEVSVDAAEAIARDHWGIDARAQPIRGERDRNFHLRTNDEREFLLKIANPAEDAAFRHMQIDALRHIARNPLDFQVPRCVPLPDGSVELRLPHPGDDTLDVRLHAWVPGLPFHEARRSAAQRAAYGAALAHLQLALVDFTHAAREHPVPWDLKHTARLREIAFSIKHAQARAVVHALVDEFEAIVAPIMPALRRQMVHNDATRMNVLVDPANYDRIAGIIDFGDIAETPVVFDVAIAALSQPAPDMSTAEAVAHFVRGFHTVRPLTREEANLLPLLVACRIAMGIALVCWHRHTQPDNPHYARPSQSFAEALGLIDEIRAPAVATAVCGACGFG
jgi:Ser/Thr protein kinase RdoA (MazF antagonist)